MCAARHHNREYGQGATVMDSQFSQPALDLTGIGKWKMRSPLLEHLKDLQDFSEMLLRQLFEKLFDRTTARLILVKLHRPWHFLNDISVKIGFQEAVATVRGVSSTLEDSHKFRVH